MLVSTAIPLHALLLSLVGVGFDTLLHDVIIARNTCRTNEEEEEERAYISTWVKQDELVTQELHLE